MKMIELANELAKTFDHVRIDFYLCDGKIYFGQYYQDKKEGIGKYTWGDGRVYIGFWKFNKQSGLGKYMNTNENNVKYGIWEEGKRIEWIDEEKLKKESDEYHNDYQEILSFEDNFREDEYEEDKIVQNLDNKVF